MRQKKCFVSQGKWSQWCLDLFLKFPLYTLLLSCSVHRLPHSEWKQSEEMSKKNGAGDILQETQISCQVMCHWGLVMHKYFVTGWEALFTHSLWYTAAKDHTNTQHSPQPNACYLQATAWKFDPCDSASHQRGVNKGKSRVVAYLLDMSFCGVYCSVKQVTEKDFLHGDKSVLLTVSSCF